MSTWAEIDENSTVIRLVKGNNNDPNGDEGYQTIVDIFGGTWIQTYFNSGGVGHPAVAGGTYIQEHGIFVPPKPYESWVLNVDTAMWEPPIPNPSNMENPMVWDEESLSWVKYKLPLLKGWHYDENDIPTPPYTPENNGNSWYWDEETESWIDTGNAII